MFRLMRRFYQAANLLELKVFKMYIASSSSFGFFLFGVATAQKYSSFDPIDFVSLPNSNPFHVFSRQIHPPSPWLSFFPFTWYCHLHHPFPTQSSSLLFRCRYQRSLASRSLSSSFAIPLTYLFLILFILVTPSAHLTIFNSATSFFLTCLSVSATISIS